MGFTQENRFNAPQPEIHDTDYGARYVNAGTETPAGVATSAKEEEKPIVDEVPSGTIVFDDADGSHASDDANLASGEQNGMADVHWDSPEQPEHTDAAAADIKHSTEEKPAKKTRKKAGRPKRNK